MDTTVLPLVDTEQPAVILYTSGTTARPKGVVHSHRTLFDTAMAIAKAVAPDAYDIGLGPTQIMHMSGMAFLVSGIYMGLSMALLPAFDPANMLDAIERFGVAYAVCLPALLQFVVEEQARKPRDVRSFRTIGVGGDSVPVALQNRFQDLFGASIWEVYGMTEALPLTLNRIAPRPGSIGLPAEGVEIRLVDLQDRDVAEGETGEIAVRSSLNCLGYWNDDDATREAIRGGWLHTGDLACRDADGYYWFKGRLKQIIIRAGSNISPQEVEEALYLHPAVREAGIVGVPDPVYGEIVVAFVVLREEGTTTAEELRRFAKQHLADYKLPDKILFVNGLPKGLTGKVDRRALKEILVDRPELLERGDAASG